MRRREGRRGARARPRGSSNRPRSGRTARIVRVLGSPSAPARPDRASRPARRPSKVARQFAEAFVVYETGGVDAKVRTSFASTATRQLSHSLLRRPPRQPASVKVPQAKVVNVVAGPSKGTTYSVSVSLLRVGVTSELRLEMEQGPGRSGK